MVGTECPAAGSHHPFVLVFQPSRSDVPDCDCAKGQTNADGSLRDRKDANAGRRNEEAPLPLVSPRHRYSRQEVDGLAQALIKAQGFFA